MKLLNGKSVVVQFEIILSAWACRRRIASDFIGFDKLALTKFLISFQTVPIQPNHVCRAIVDYVLKEISHEIKLVLFLIIKAD